MKKSKILYLLNQEIRRRNYSHRTEEAYSLWIRQYVRFHDMTHPRELGGEHVEVFLNYLVNKRNVAASTQNQALCTLVFLYEQVLSIKVDGLHNLKRAKKSRLLPLVLSEAEVSQLLSHVSGIEGLIVRLLYGAGLRIGEALRLRVMDLDFGYSQIFVRNGKGLQDRVTILPDALSDELKLHVK